MSSLCVIIVYIIQKYDYRLHTFICNSINDFNRTCAISLGGADSMIIDKVKEIIVEQLGVAENAVTTEASFIEDLGADSLDIVELIMAIEEKFDMEIPDSAAEKIVTVGDVVEYIKNNK